MKRALFIFAILLPVVVMAQEDIFLPPDWLKEVMLFIASLPTVGPIFLEVMKWLGVIASVLTVVSTAFLAVSFALQKVFKLAKLEAWAAKVDKIYKLISPYLKFLSMYNVQKKELGRGGDSKASPPVA